jgi:hypothetical protein
VVIVCEQIFFRVWTGDWLYKVHALGGAYGANPTEEYPVTLWSVTFYLRSVIFDTTVSGLWGWLLLAGLLASHQRVREMRLLLTWCVVFFVFLQLGTTNPADWNLFPQQPRYIAPAVVLLFIPLAATIIALANASGSASTRAAVAIGLFALVMHGVGEARTRMQSGLYSFEIPAAAGQVLAMQDTSARWKDKPVIVPDQTLRKLPHDLRARAAHWTQLPVDVFSGESAAICSGGCLVLVPSRVPGENVSAGYPSLELIANLTSPVSSMDRLLKKMPVGLLQRRAQEMHVGQLFRCCRTN